MLLPKKWPQQVSYATEHYGREDFDQIMDQQKTNRVKRGGVR